MFRLLFLCSFAILFSFCKGEKTPANTAVSADTPANTATASTAAATPAVKKNYEASHEAPYCKMWHVKIAAGVDNPADYKGLWFELKKDGSFDCGKYQDQTNSGTWSIGENTNIIRLLYHKSDIIPGNWQIQGSGGGGKILWKGNVPGNPRGYQIVLEPDTVRPSEG